MLRQRLRGRTSPLAFAGRALTVLLALALIWYGLMTILLAFKVAPSTVNAISGYRTAFAFLAGLTAGDVDGVTRAIVAGAGVLAFVVFGYLALKALPRPYLARRELELAHDDHGEVQVAPRAFERLAEAAASRDGAVASAAGRYGVDNLTVLLTVRRARDLAQTLEGAQRRVVEALEQHGLPAMPVNVTLAGYDAPKGRTLR
jgi:hypothetical protein